MAVIHVLDKHTAELIAAGEVVERPASVVKELLENSIDAGATKVTVSIESGGVRLIEVSDNGSGIEAEYISTAFIRHATSKIATEADLNAIHTLGFRGEALASIASVARVEVLTRTEPDEFACLYRIEGGEELPIEPGARGVGTTIRVRDLFYNTPARMKFLKKDSSEGTFVADIIAHVALSHPEISFKFVREGKLQYVTPGDGQMMNAAYSVLGREFTRGLLAVQDKSGEYSVRGLITPPKSCRASRSMQYFYINGRYVKNRTMMAALEGAFKGTAMQGKFPGCILMLDMPADLVDVNVHPAKTEVRFARENDVFDVVYHAVKLALAQPGSGERLFTFDTSTEQTDASKDTTEKKTDKNNENTQNNTEKQTRFTGLSAVIEGQAEPGTLRRMPTPSQPTAVSPKKAENDSPATEEKLPSYVIPFDAPLVSDNSFHSPLPESVLSQSKEYGGSFRVAAGESTLDIQPEEDDFLPNNSAFNAPKTNESVPKSRSPFVVEEKAASAPQEAWWKQTPPEPEQEPKQETLSEPTFDTDAVAVSELEQGEQTALYEQDEEALQYVGEIFKTYILAQRGDELCLIDKHAAHERQLFEKLAANYGEVAGQLLLAPVTVDLSAEEKQAVLDNRDLLDNAGLEISDFGGSTVVLRTVPADVEPTDAENLLIELADKLAKGSRDALNERTEWVLHSIACRAAIKAGDRTSPQELLVLAQKILSGEVPPFCPHGRPCVLKLTRKELEKQFGRIV
jgi:DNA mismatch repair protein MutL